jgi:hypothetical protein
MKMIERHCKYRGRGQVENYDIDVWMAFHEGKHLHPSWLKWLLLPLGRAFSSLKFSLEA